MKDQPELHAALGTEDLKIRVTGRGDFRFGRILQEFLSEVPQNLINRLLFDLSLCPSIDSTFAGTLAMVAIRLEGAGIKTVLSNAVPCVMGTLLELGVDRLFSFSEEPTDDSISWHRLEDDFPNPNLNLESHREATLKAHRILGSINDQNRARFKELIDALQKKTE